MVSMFRMIWENITIKITTPEVDLTGRVCLVTGGNQGLGLETAIHFARANAARIIITSRDKQRGEAAAAHLFKTVTSYRGTVDVWPLDLASFASVNELAERVKKECPRLDIAVLNAGIVSLTWGMTDDGWEETLQVNVLSTGLLGMLLLPKLLEAGDFPVPIPASGQNGLDKPHLVIVASGVHYWARLKQQEVPGSLLAALNNKKYHSFDDTYNISKLLDVFLAREIAGLPSTSGKVVVNSVDPGLCKSNLRRRMPWILEVFLNLVGRSTSSGALNLLIAAVTSTAPGAFISNGLDRPVSHFAASTKGYALQKKFWNEAVEVWKSTNPEISQLL